MFRAVVGGLCTIVYLLAAWLAGSVAIHCYMSRQKYAIRLGAVWFMLTCLAAYFCSYAIGAV